MNPGIISSLFSSGVDWHVGVEFAGVLGVGVAGGVDVFRLIPSCRS